MPRTSDTDSDRASRLSFWILAALLAILWIAGGASRADVLGQAVVRFFAWAGLIACIVFCPHFKWRNITPLIILLGLSVVLVAAQLVPLPPAIWSSLPGRALFLQAAEVTGQAQPWRPLSISPGATANALGALIVPVTVLVLAANLTREQHWRIASIALVLVAASCALALLQFSGSRLDNPFVNDVRGMVAGNFANRNHFALFVAMGCLIAPVWAFRDKEDRGPKSLFAIGVLPLFALIILSTGSRMGILAGATAIVLGILAVQKPIRDQFAGMNRKLSIPLIATFGFSILLVIGLSVVLNRAVSIERALTLSPGEDLRWRALPTVMSMVERYFPAGSGFGTFDPVYRISEIDSLLQLKYLNHAHNDLLEIVLDGGLAGLVLLVAAIVFWLYRSYRAWRGAGCTDRELARLGSTIPLLVLIASVTDYPARTPLIMAMLTIAAVWLTIPTQHGKAKRI